MHERVIKNIAIAFSAREDTKPILFRELVKFNPRARAGRMSDLMLLGLAMEEIIQSRRNGSAPETPISLVIDQYIQKNLAALLSNQSPLPSQSSPGNGHKDNSGREAPVNQVIGGISQESSDCVTKFVVAMNLDY